MWVYSGHSKLQAYFGWCFNGTMDCLIRLVVVHHEDCSFKCQNQICKSNVKILLSVQAITFQLCQLLKLE